MRACRFLLLLLIVVAIAAAACDATSDGVASTAGTTGDLVTIPDGTHFGFVRDVAEHGVLFDPAEFLSGEAALNAARAAGFIGPTGDLSDNFYIDNPNVEGVPLKVDPAAEFTLITWDSAGDLTEKVVSFDELARLWSGPTYDHILQDTDFVLGELPITLTISEGRVTGGEEQYLP